MIRVPVGEQHEIQSLDPTSVEEGVDPRPGFARPTVDEDGLAGGGPDQGGIPLPHIEKIHANLIRRSRPVRGHAPASGQAGQNQKHLP
jgi:hypothetical protein